MNFSAIEEKLNTLRNNFKYVKNCKQYIFKFVRKELLDIYQDQAGEHYDQECKNINREEFNALYDKVADNKIFGMLGREEAHALWIMGQEVSGNILELGTFLGLSTVFLAQKNKTYTIDYGYNQMTYPIEIEILNKYFYDEDVSKYLENTTKGNICKNNWQKMGVDQNIIPICKVSVDAVDDVPDNLDLIFVDDDHTYGGVRKSIEMFYKRLNKNGYIVFHDVQEGFTVLEAVHEFYLENKEDLYKPWMTGCLLIFKKK